MNSRAKGARGEREWRDCLRAEGWMARRGQQFSGHPDAPDVVCEELGRFRFEVKRAERFSPYDAMAQANAEKGDGQIAVVAHRKNNSPWLIVLRAEDFFALVRETLDGNAAAAAAGKDDE